MKVTHVRHEKCIKSEENRKLGDICIDGRILLKWSLKK
jgi:hypothetical protein